MNRHVGIIAGTFAAFMVIVFVALRIMPGPHKSTDYLVIGAIATMVCLLLLFVLLINTSAKRPNPFFKTRRQPPQKPGLGLRD